VASVIAAFSGAPRNFHIAGGNPDSLRTWAWEAGGWRSEVDMMDATSMRYAASIEENRKVLESGSWRVNASLIIGGASPIMGLIAFFATRLF
jgi:hypothetical protein